MQHTKHRSGPRDLPDFVHRLLCGGLSDADAASAMRELRGRAVAGDLDAVREYLDVAEWAGVDTAQIALQQLGATNE